MKVIELLDQIQLREIKAADTIKYTPLIDMQMNITELFSLDFTIISLATSKVDRELAEAGVNIATFKNNMHKYLNDILIDSTHNPGRIKEFDSELDEVYEMMRYSETVKKVHKNMLNCYYNALEEQYRKKEAIRKVVPFPKRKN